MLAPEAPPYVNKRGEANKPDEEQAVAGMPTLPNYGATIKDDDGTK